MARLPRIQFSGALYHVFNQGNYQQELFPTPTEAASFISCLAATCDKMGWIVHAYGLLRNNYHLVIETPSENLIEGVHWLQGTYANRFNRSRSQNGHLFQGRYKAILVEPGHALTDLVSYVHLIPVLEKLITIEQLPQFRWSSFRSFYSGDHPSFLSCSRWLKTFNLAENQEPWEAYFQQLKSLSSNHDIQRKKKFPSMSSGWAIGSAEFKNSMIQKLTKLQKTKGWSANSRHELSELHWSKYLEEGKIHLKETTETSLSDKKSALWKLMLATWMRQQTSASNKWLADNLRMGTPGTVSAYVGQFIRNGGPQTREFRVLSQKLKRLIIEP
jgi:REP element-mobilizing transposase RayT